MRKLSTRAEALEDAWDAIPRPGNVTLSVALRDRDGVLAARDEDVEHYAASTAKLPVLIAALDAVAAGRIDPGAAVPVVDEFPASDGGRFRLSAGDDQDDATWSRVGQAERFEILLERMVVRSGNLATNLVLGALGLGPVQRVLRDATGAGMTVRHLVGDAAGRRLQPNRVTASAFTDLLDALATGRVLDPAMTERALALLARQEHRSRIPAGLPAGAWVAGKPGWTADVEHDGALIRPGKGTGYVLAVCTTGAGAGGADLIARVSAVTWEHWRAWHG